MDRLLQRAPSTPGARRPPADGGLARGGRRRGDCGHDGQRIRVAHMPTAAEADAASRCVIERNNERPGCQSRTEIKRSRCAGPFHPRRLPSSRRYRTGAAPSFSSWKTPWPQAPGSAAAANGRCAAILTAARSPSERRRRRILTAVVRADLRDSAGDPASTAARGAPAPSTFDPYLER